MLTISNANIDLVRKLCSIETAIHICPNTVLDLDSQRVLDMLSSNEISKEVALRSAHVLGCDLGTVKDMTMLERFASIHNPSYAQSWYAIRDYWPRMLYCNPENSDILSDLLKNLSAEEIAKFDYTQQRYLAAKVPHLEVIAKAPVGNVNYPQPVFKVNDPVLGEWRLRLTAEIASKLFESTQWDIFNPESDDYILVNISDVETEALLGSARPLPVIVARGRWTRNNISRVIERIEESEDRDALMIILYERTCALWGDESVLAMNIKERLHYQAILNSERVLKVFTSQWHCSIPPINYYLVNANYLDLRRLIESNINANTSFFDLVDIATPEAIRAVCVDCIHWLTEYRPNDSKAIRNVLAVLTEHTADVPWSPATAEIVRRGLQYSNTQKLLLQFMLMPTFPTVFKREFVDFRCK